MRTLPQELAAEITKQAFTIYHLFIFEFAKTYRWTDCPNNIYYAGEWYLAKAISFDAVSLSMNPRVDQITVNLDDVDKKITKIILSEDIRDKRMKIYAVPLDSNLSPIGTALMLFLGYCDASSKQIGRKSFTIEIYNDMIKWKRLTPRRITTPTCIWDFKNGPAKILGSNGYTYTCILDHCGHPSNFPITGGDWATYWQLTGSGGIQWIEGDWYTVGTCRYSGAETWCDRSWDRCNALSNTINYGGFRYLPGLLGKQINWGQASDPTVRWAIAYYNLRH